MPRKGRANEPVEPGCFSSLLTWCGCGRGRGECVGDDAPKIPPPDPRPRRGSQTNKSGGLWQKAYEELVKQDPELIKAYQSVLIRVAPKSAPTPPPSKPEIHHLEEVDSGSLAEAVTQGLAQTKEAEVATQVDGEVMKVLVGVKDLIAGALFSFPPAAAAWTGLMVVFGVGRIYR